MGKLIHRGLLLALLLPAWSVFAAPRLKIDLDGRKAGMIFTGMRQEGGVSLEHPAWLPETSRGSYLAVESRKPLDDRWRRFAFSFVPGKSGVIGFNLRGNPTDKNTVGWIAYDDFKVSGAELMNPSFERLANGRLAGWRFSVHAPKLNRNDAAHGRNYVESAQYFMVTQPLAVTAGKRVTVSFAARAGKEEPRPADNRMVPESEYPIEYYRYYSPQVQYLPLRDKGLSGDSIGREAPHLGSSEPPPRAAFVIPPPGREPGVAATTVPLELLEESGRSRTASIRAGFPLPRGALWDLRHLQVLDGNGSPVPCQTAATGFWPDRSLRWVLLQFDAPLRGGQRAMYQVRFGRGVTATPMPPERRVRWHADDRTLTVDTGALTAVIDKKHFNILRNIRCGGRRVGSFAPEGLSIIDLEGGTCSGSVEPPSRVEIEERGPLRLTVRVDGRFSGGPLGSYTVRLYFRAASPVVKLEISYLNHNLVTEFTDYTALNLRYLPAEPALGLSMDRFRVGRGGRIFQQNERELSVNGRSERAGLSGAGTVRSNGKPLTFCLRDAAFRYPKAFRCRNGAVDFELLPELPDAKFGTELPFYLQFPFCEGKYRFKWGMHFTETLLLDFSGETAAADLAAPEVVARIDRDYLARHRFFPGVLPTSCRMFDEWDRKAVEAFYAHMRIKEERREYGFLNYGDFFGERGVNWTNNEYDLAHGLYMLFLRTGNRDLFRWARLAARHQADVDIIHAYPDPLYHGTNNQHSIGHTGAKKPRNATWSYFLNDNNWGSAGHSWSEGMLETWAFTGDAGIMDSALELGEHMVRYAVPMFKTLGTHERSAGWMLRAIMAFYRITGEKRYLDAAEKVLNIALKERQPGKGGAWPHVMPNGHAGFFRREETYGNCPFLINVLLEGMIQYYLETGDPRVNEAINGGAGWLSRACDRNLFAWPYGADWTGTPYSKIRSDDNTLASSGMMFSAARTGNREIYELARGLMLTMTFCGPNPVGNWYPIDLVFTPQLMSSIYDYCRRHPEVPPYRYDFRELNRLMDSRAEPRFRVRGPKKKEFLLVCRSDRPEITVVRSLLGLNPRSGKSCRITLLAPNGDAVWSRDFPANTRNIRQKLTVPGRRNEKFTLQIDDGYTGCWSVLPAAGVDCFWRLDRRRSTVSNGNVQRFYLTVPAGTREFAVTVVGIHPGRFRAALLRPDGGLEREVTGENTGGSRLPWLKTSGLEPAATIRVSRKHPTEVTECWTLLTGCGNDLGLRIDGAPPMLSLTPTPYLEKRDEND